MGEQQNKRLVKVLTEIPPWAIRDVGRLSRNPANSCLTLAAKARAAASLQAKQAEDLFRWQQLVVFA